MEICVKSWKKLSTVTNFDQKQILLRKNIQKQDEADKNDGEKNYMNLFLFCT